MGKHKPKDDLPEITIDPVFHRIARQERLNPYEIAAVFSEDMMDAGFLRKIAAMVRQADPTNPDPKIAKQGKADMKMLMQYCLKLVVPQHTSADIMHHKAQASELDGLDLTELKDLGKKGAQELLRLVEKQDENNALIVDHSEVLRVKREREAREEVESRVEGSEENAPGVMSQGSSERQEHPDHGQGAPGQDPMEH